MSGLLKTVADNNRGFLLSAEIYDVLFKLLKSDEENATGDVQALCQLFSREEASYWYATEKTREITRHALCLYGHALSLKHENCSYIKKIGCQLD